MVRPLFLLALALLALVGCAHATPDVAAKVSRPCVATGAVGPATDTGTLYEAVLCGDLVFYVPRSCPEPK